MIPNDYHIREMIKKIKQDNKLGIYRPPGFYSNSIIRDRNKGIKHLFEDSIGGNSSNYK